MLTASPALAAFEMGAVRHELRPDPPPPSPYMSEADLEILTQAFEAVRRDDWRRALDLANQASDSVGRDLVRWLWVKDGDADAPFSAVVEFMNSHPDWPDQDTMLRRAEEALPDDMPAAQVIAWFAGNAPVTSDGMLRLADAHLAQGAESFAAHWVRSAWVEHDFSRSEEIRFLSRYGRFIREEDQIARAERLLWEHDYNAAERMRARVPSAFRQLMDAWLALIALDSNASARVAGVPAEYELHPGLLYERARWRRRKDRDEEAWALIVAAPTTAEELGNAERWWVERHIQARNALREGSPETAYDMVRGHGLTEGADFAEAEWLAGWIALRFLDEADAALLHFLRLREGVSYPISVARAEYWAGRAHEVLGNRQDAREAYLRAAENPTTFYGQLAMEALGDGYNRLALPAPPQVDPNRREVLRRHELVHSATLLSEVATERLQFNWFRHLGETFDDPHDLQVIADLAREIDQWHMAVRVGKIAMFDHIYLTETTYPLVPYNNFESDLPLPEMALVLGLSRQESEFNPEARSHAGARGLMQLMPSTARITARRLGVPYETDWLTEDPSYNTQLGRYHLGELLDRFDGSYIMTIAAYNAGAHRVDRWVREYGDPRSGTIDPIDWVELIPFRETRNYVQRVLENTMVYRNRLTGLDLEVTMTRDLARAEGQPPVMLANRPNLFAQMASVLRFERGSGEIAVADIAPIPDPKDLLEAAAPANAYPSEGRRVVVPLANADAPPRMTPVLPRQTLTGPEIQIWDPQASCLPTQRDSRCSDPAP
jgi:soluble lytic murein transglycosylase